MPFLSKLMASKSDSQPEPFLPEDGSAKSTAKDDRWIENEYEGQLAVDVYQDEGSIYIKSTIAGVKPEDLEINATDEMVTIRGKRQQEERVEDQDYIFQECYWGGFSRSIILPVEVNPDKVKATLKNGVLTVVLPKVQRSKAVNVRVVTHVEDE